MDSFLSRYKNILVLVSVLVVQIIGLAAQIRRPNAEGQDGSGVRMLRSWATGLITPPEKALHGTGQGLGHLWSNYLDLRHVRRQNQALRDQVGRLQLEQAALLEDARQGERLQRLLGFRQHYIYATVPAQVIGTAGADQSRVLYIDKGAADGLKPDMAVITPDGIVGKLKDVFSHTAQVLEISDQSSGAGVLLESTRLRGVLRGNALGQPQIINLLPDDRVKAGERVITSGGDQIFPRGLPVGIVDHVVDDPQNPPFVDIVIKPAANLGHLGEVLIITQTAPLMPAREKHDLAESAAAGAAAAAAAPVAPARAADVLAERLPGLDAPAATASGQAAAADQIPPPVKAPPASHADRYTPDETPPAADLIPGKAFAPPNPAPLPATRPQAVRSSAKTGHVKPEAARPEPVQPAAKPEAKSKAKPTIKSTTAARPVVGVDSTPAQPGPPRNAGVHAGAHVQEPPQ